MIKPSGRHISGPKLPDQSIILFDGRRSVLKLLPGILLPVRGTLKCYTSKRLVLVSDTGLQKCSMQSARFT